MKGIVNLLISFATEPTTWEEMLAIIHAIM